MPCGCIDERTRMCCRGSHRAGEMGWGGLFALYNKGGLPATMCSAFSSIPKGPCGSGPTREWAGTTAWRSRPSGDRRIGEQYGGSSSGGPQGGLWIGTRNGSANIGTAFSPATARRTDCATETSRIWRSIGAKRCGCGRPRECIGSRRAGFLPPRSDRCCHRGQDARLGPGSPSSPR